MRNGAIASFLLVIGIFSLTQDYYIFGFLLFTAGLYVIDEQTFVSGIFKNKKTWKQK